MARPQQNTVSYFPFYVEDGKKMAYIEHRYGNDGFTVLFKILRELARTEYHYLILSDKVSLLHLTARCNIDKNKLLDIINDLVEVGKFDEELWQNYRIIWCESFIESIQDAYKRRENDCISKDTLLHTLSNINSINVCNNSINAYINSINVCNNPQRKEKKRKENKIKKNKSKNSLENFQEFRVREFEKLDEEIKNKLISNFGISKPIIYLTDNINSQYVDLVEIILQTVNDTEWLMSLKSSGYNSEVISKKIKSFIKFQLESQTFRNEKYLSKSEFQQHFYNKELKQR